MRGDDNATEVSSFPRTKRILTKKMIDAFDIILIILLVAAIGLFGGLIYIIYLPFRRRLIKSGKLTDKLNRKINRSFIIFLCALGIIIFYFRDYGRTPSKNRLEKISNINLPNDFKVLKDEYQDMMQDYCILYDIQIGKNSGAELTRNIKKSKFYNPNSINNGVWIKKDLMVVDSVKAVWAKSTKGYYFNRQDGLTNYKIELDTVTYILKYTECSD